MPPVLPKEVIAAEIFAHISPPASWSASGVPLSDVPTRGPAAWTPTDWTHRQATPMANVRILMSRAPSKKHGQKFMASAVRALRAVDVGNECPPETPRLAARMPDRA